MAILSTSADSTSKTFYIQQLNVNAKSCKFTKGFNNIMFSDNSLNREPRLNGDLKNSILKKLQERIRGDTYDRNNVSIVFTLIISHIWIPFYRKICSQGN